MHKRTHQLIGFILVIVFTAACETVPTPTSSPTPIMTVAAPTNLSPTVTPTIMLLMPTTLPATAANSPPITAPLTEEVEADTNTNQDNSNVMETNRMNLTIGDHVLTATLVENSSAEALKDVLAEGPITINMRDYDRMEKVGPLGMDLPRNDEQITTEAGDIILFQGNAFVIYYAPNSWNFTRLGKINNVAAEELKEILGDGNVTITLSLAQE